MIHLEDGYAIDADSMQFKLVQKTENGWAVRGYYPTVAALIGGLTEARLYRAVKFMQTLVEVQEDLVAWADRMKTPLVDDLKAAIRAYEEKKSD